ncbi:hypothetical protein CCY01nite_40480 [Chitinophaga cymbidii]|uniref:Uncharacterized protein n=2 Tax=Chitinophaga cymbidii TaxID=1096750 RepID=A0A512RQ10_9BACT|nr:hypothetical protein CCY01nite_40480 [Chitinophaga cymbidii]
MLDSIRSIYMISDAAGILYNPGVSSSAYFSYQGNRITRRNGGTLPVPNVSGVAGIYSQEVYDTVLYQGNRIILETHTRLNVTVPVNKRELILENGRIVKKIYFSNLSDHKDTAFYFYDAANRISRKELRNSDRTLTQVFTFDQQGNLQSIRSTLQINGQAKPNFVEDESFQHYDNRPNSLKGYWMWDDLYYRSLSRNNFSKYDFLKTYESMNGQSMEAGGNEWTLVPHANGYIDYGR